MFNSGYHWTICECDDGWLWSIRDARGGPAVVQGEAPSRAVAAALVVRALARGVTETAALSELAA